jgi:hypothetical protein
MLLRYVLILELKVKVKKKFRIKYNFFAAWRLQCPTGDTRGREAGGEIG